MEETETQPADYFPVTRWSLVLQAKEGEEGSRTRALGELCTHYWYPLYAFIRRRGYSVPEAEDLTQGFFAQLLAKDRVQLFSEAKGKLRAYLLGAIKNHLANEHAKASAQKRGGGVAPISFDAVTAEERYRLEPPELNSPEKLFEMRWALDLLEAAFARLRGEYERAGKTELYEALKGQLSGADPAGGYGAIGAELGMTDGAVRVALHRLRKRYRSALEEVIADTVADPSEVGAEIDYLLQIFD